LIAPIALIETAGDVKLDKSTTNRGTALKREQAALLESRVTMFASVPNAATFSALHNMLQHQPGIQTRAIHPEGTEPVPYTVVSALTGAALERWPRQVIQATQAVAGNETGIHAHLCFMYRQAINRASALVSDSLFTFSSSAVVATCTSKRLGMQ
jgi:hypothetical protein